MSLTLAGVLGKCKDTRRRIRVRRSSSCSNTTPKTLPCGQKPGRVCKMDMKAIFYEQAVTQDVMGATRTSGFEIYACSDLVGHAKLVPKEYPLKIALFGLVGSSPGNLTDLFPKRCVATNTRPEYFGKGKEEMMASMMPTSPVLDVKWIVDSESGQRSLYQILRVVAFFQ